MANRIGFHVRSMDEFERVIQIPRVNVVELKPDQIEKKSGVSLYFFDGKEFRPNLKLIGEIDNMCRKRNVSIQVHLPYEEEHDPSTERGLCQADRAHHDLILKRYKMFKGIFYSSMVGSVLTTHPPAYRFNGVDLWEEQEALEAGRELYARVSREILGSKDDFKLGLENMVAPKDTGASSLGFKPWHLDKLIGDSKGIGITVDSGHRNLNNDMSIRLLFSLAPVVNVHFHSNLGIVLQDTYDDDGHLFATKDNLPHYGRYIKTFGRFGPPIILEIEDLENRSDSELSDYVQNLRREIEKV